MEKIEATFRIVTPMFIGGADQTPSDGIRPPSVKGALRFWWRALNWGKFYNKANALEELYKAEAVLFGSAAGRKSGGGQGVFLLTTEHKRLEEGSANSVYTAFKPKPAASYLAYGLVVPYGQRAGSLERACIKEDQTFTVKLIFRNKVDDSIVVALKALGLLSGLGSRSRHGMGSVALERISCNENSIWNAPKTEEKYRAEIKKLLGTFSSVPQADYSAFSKNSRVDYLLNTDCPFGVLNQFGLKMLDYRSWGQTQGRNNILPSGAESEYRFDDDHDWFRDANYRRKHPNFHPRRVVFGLPHNYDQHGEFHVIPEKHERRASPLFFHVHRISSKEYVGISIFLKSRFLPEGERIRTGTRIVGREKKAALVDQNIDWTVITDFLDGKAGNPPTDEDRFPDKKAVLS